MHDPDNILIHSLFPGTLGFGQNDFRRAEHDRAYGSKDLNTHTIADTVSASTGAVIFIELIVARRQGVTNAVMSNEIFCPGPPRAQGIEGQFLAGVRLRS